MWNEIATDGLPDSDPSGNVKLYEVYDANAETPAVAFTGRFNDNWMYGMTPTHWKLWAGSEPPAVAPEIWHEVATDGDPQEAPVALYEIFATSEEDPDGSTGLTVNVLGQWNVTEGITVTHWKPLTLSDPPAP